MSENLLQKVFAHQEDNSSSKDKDLRLKLSVENNVLWKKIHEKFPSVRALCKAYPDLHISPSEVGKLLTFKMSPMRKTWVEGEERCIWQYRKVCLSLESALGCPAEQLFPESLYKKFVGVKTTDALEVSSFSALPFVQQHQLPLLLAPEVSERVLILEELGEKMEEVLKTLTDREQKVIQLRYGVPDGTIHTLNQVGEVFGISTERVRQIEAKALSKLRRPFCSGRLRSFVD